MPGIFYPEEFFFCRSRFVKRLNTSKFILINCPSSQSLLISKSAKVPKLKVFSILSSLIPQNKTRNRFYLSLPHHFPNFSIISLKLSSPASIFSIISVAKTSGSGRLSRSVKLLSLSQKISRLVLSRATIWS